MRTTIRKTIDRIFVLRVSGKGDAKGSANQLEVLKDYAHLPDVVAFLDLFDVRMMKASSQRGEQLRREWAREHGLAVLNRAGRQDFLGISVVIGRTKFIVYASTAAKMDEPTGNAFTRHLCEAIADPNFNGMADPSFLTARDDGSFDGGEHPSVVYAFDPTRFCRSMTAATQLFDAAARDRVAFEAKELHIDPAQGDAARLMWTFLAYGSEVEATVGKLRRFVGRLNKARAGHWCYREGMVPLGCRRVPVDGLHDTYELAVDEKHVTSVAALAKIGLRPDATHAQILRMLGEECGVSSGDPKTLGVPVHELGSGAAKRFFMRRKLRAYRDGWLDLEFVGVLENQMRPGSGHLLTRRWEGLDGRGQPDRWGSVTYTVRFPKPTVMGPEGKPREGWIAGVTDEQERHMWDQLIRLRGTDETGGRSAEEKDADESEEPGDDASDHDTRAVSRRRRGGRTASRVVPALCPPDRDTEDGRRTFLRPRKAASGGGEDRVNYELRAETAAPGRNGGIRRGASTSKLLATFAERDITAGVAALISQAVRAVTDQGHDVVPHQVSLSPELARLVTAANPRAERARREQDLEERSRKAHALAKGYDRTAAQLRGEGREETDPRLASAKEEAARAWLEWHATEDALQRLRETVLPEASAPALPHLDAANPRDLVVGLRGIYATGAVPPGFIDALRMTVPTPLRFQPGADRLQWDLVGDVTLATVGGETLTVADCRAPVTTHHGRSGADGARTWRASDMAARRMRDGHAIAEVATISAVVVTRATRLIAGHLRATGQFPDGVRLTQAIACPIAETTRVLWDHACGRAPAATDAFGRHMVAVFTAPTNPRAARGRHAPWAYALDTDRRRDQITIVAHARDPENGIRADALAVMLDRDDPRPRRVLDASTHTVKVNGVYPPTLRRLPAPGCPEGWYGRTPNPIPAADKRVGLTPCTHADCPEPYATVMVPAIEVLALGTMMLCRRCRRAATPPDHPAFATAGTMRFSQGYIDWFDAQPARAGHVVDCAARCGRDVGLGAGKTWRWVDDPESAAWHDDDCRAGAATATYARCRHADCVIDEGAGPGSLRHDPRRARRVWHSRKCELAERRRLRAAKVEYVTCKLGGCTIDEGGGPGSIRKNRGLGGPRAFHNPSCRRAFNKGRDAILIRRWAEANGHPVPTTGRLPEALAAAYRAAQNPDAR